MGSGLSACPSCGAEIVPGEETCPECGSDLYEVGVHAPSGMEARLLKEKVKNLPLKATVAVTTDTPLSEVVRLMKDSGVGCALVYDPSRPLPNLTGVNSDRTLLRGVEEKGGRFSIEGVKAGAIQKKNPDTVSEDDPIAFALYKMNHGRYRHIPVIDGDGKARILSVRDILAYFAQGLA